MDLSFTPEQVAFRAEVRSWIASALPPPLAAKAAVDAPFEMSETMEWHRLLYKRGWIAPNWP
jgi:alkylation response protein AidB-like acyl-CoA dehydrogenase